MPHETAPWNHESNKNTTATLCTQTATALSHLKGSSYMTDKSHLLITLFNIYSWYSRTIRLTVVVELADETVTIQRTLEKLLDWMCWVKINLGERKSDNSGYIVFI